MGGRRQLTWLLPGVVALISGGLAAVASPGASAATPPTLNLKILLIGEGGADVTTTAWRAALDSEGVPYTLVTASGSPGSETVSLPALSSGRTGNYNGVVIADSPTDYAAGALSALDSYESAFGVRQVDGYMYPSPSLGVTETTGGPLDGTTATLTSAGLTAFPELKGPVPFDIGTYGYGASVSNGAAYTPFITDSAGDTMAGVYRHPAGDPQAGVFELALNFDYNANQTQWLLLAPGLINWVTQDTHLGLYRNYFGQDVDDAFIADNEWSSQYQCTPAATDPPDYTCPPGEQAAKPGSGPGVPADVQMSAADVAYVTNWEQQTGIKLELAFNGIGACTADTSADKSNANCTGSRADGSTTYTDPGQIVDPSYPNDAGLVNALLASQSDFNWITHTWSHLFLGCTQWQPQALTSVTASGSGGTLSAGSYSYEITAATAYGESEPSSPQPVTAGSGGSVTLTWPEAGNGTGTNGTSGPSLAKEEASHTGGTGFWGYNVYRENPGASTYGLVGQVEENPAATSASTYSFTDTGQAAGAQPNSGPGFPTATNPGIDCSSVAGSWLPATSTQADSSIDQEIGLDQAFAAANGLTSYTPAAVLTGEHSGVENPNMPGALADTGITTIASDASRQPQQYSIGGALTAPRYPSNIYYNASNWPDELNEYNTLYVAKGVSLGSSAFPGETGHCTDTSATTCLGAPATDASLLAAETHIMLSHVLSNDPRVGYAHQSNLIGPATQNGQDYGYTILDLIDHMRSQYNSWYTTAAPLDQVTDVTDARVLAEQGAWAGSAGQVSASVQNGVVTITNGGPGVSVPVTVPPGTTTGGSAFGEPYGGQLSQWVSLNNGSTQTLTEKTGPSITSAASATSIVGTAFGFTVTTTGAPAPSISETGSLPAGVTFTDNGDGTATISGTAGPGSGGSYPITITAANGAGSATQSFTLANDEAPAITSAATAAFSSGTAGNYTVTTTGYPAPAITEQGTLPAGLSFKDKGDGTATISGTASGPGSYPVTISASNASGSTATLVVTITVSASSAPAITSGSVADFTLNQAGAVAITATGSPVPAITETGALPAGLSFADNGNGAALLSGTPNATGTTSLTIKASNGVSPDATQTYTLVVGQAPAFTSAGTAAGGAGSPFSFTVTTSGYPAPSFGWSTVPPGLTFTDNGDGTATLAGTPTIPGTYPMALAAASAYGTAQQTLIVTVRQAPAITSANAATFSVGKQGSFSVTTTGSPAAAITKSGSLPSGVTLTDNGDGTATLAGTPATGTKGSYPISITAANGVQPDATQQFTLTVGDAPAPPVITSANAATFAVGTQGSFAVTTTGSPTAAISAVSSPALPSGITFTDNGNGTATLAGTPAAAGSYQITITASNGVSPDASQTFTLAVTANSAAPKITSANAAVFAAGQPGTFTVTTTGSPTAAISATSSPALPSGLAFTDNGDGTAKLAGQPKAGSQGSYVLTVTASNSAGTATQALILTVNSGLAITSAAAATATAGQAFSFTVTTVGSPTPTLTRTGSLPTGITWTANTDGTATISGTAAATTHGSYPLTIVAKNPTGVTSQAYTLTVDEVPAFSSSASVSETAGTAFSYLVSTRGYPTATLSSGSLPAGVSFADNGDGTGTLSGTAAAATSKVVITAANAGGTTTQTISLAVRAPKPGPLTPVPAFTSPAQTAAMTGQPFLFTVTTAGSPVALTSLTRSGTLPAGVTFLSLGNGTATFTGTPTAGGRYPVTLTAKNSAGTTTQVFVLNVTAAPVITTGANVTGTVGSAFSYTVKATGVPTPAMAEAGLLPPGLTWTDNGNGTASLAGVPGQGGSYKLTVSASSLLGTATQAFTLTVNQAPAITSPATATATHGTPFSFTFTSTGYPRANLGHAGSVPGLAFTNTGNGTLTLSGTPARAGTYAITVTVKNSFGSDSQAFTLKVS